MHVCVKERERKDLAKMDGSVCIVPLWFRSTVNPEIFGVKIFSDTSKNPKIKNTKIFLLRNFSTRNYLIRC